MLKEEISTSLKAQLYERVSSPVFGSILVFWLIFNWVVTQPNALLSGWLMFSY